jgi:autophagy-related protein 2
VNCIKEQRTVLKPFLSSHGASFSLRIHNTDVSLLLYDGFDWTRTRKTIEKEVKEMRIRLTKIKQLVAKGQTQDPLTEQTGALLFNSIYVGLEQDPTQLEPDDLVAAIDEELNDDFDEIATQSSWQSLPPPHAGTSPPAPAPTSMGIPRQKSTRLHGRRLTRAKESSIEICLHNLEAEVDKYLPNDVLISRTHVTVKDIEILDHIKTSTWSKFLTGKHSDSRGNVRETDSNMVKIELRTVRSAPGHTSEEARLKVGTLLMRFRLQNLNRPDRLRCFP